MAKKARNRAQLFVSRLVELSGGGAIGVKAPTVRRRHIATAVLLFLAVNLLCLGLVSPHPTSAATGIESQLSFEGKIVNSSGTNIPDGSYNMEFKIYTGCTNNTGSGCTLAWTEDYLVSQSDGVNFTSGTYQANLGQYCPFSGGACTPSAASDGNTNTAVPWGTYPLYLSLQIGNTSSCSPTTNNFTAACGGDGVMSPYILLTSTPYSFNSGELGGIAASGFIQTAPTVAQTIQAAGNTTGLIVEQNAGGTYGSDIFDVQGTGGSSDNFIQVTSSAANTGNVNIASQGSSSTVGISAGSAGTVTLGSQSVTNTVNIGATGSVAVASTVNIGTSSTASNAQTVNIGSTSDASNAVTIAAGGSSSITENTGTGGTIYLGNDPSGVTNETVDIGDVSGAATTDTSTVNIATYNSGTGTQTLNAGSTEGASVTSIQAGTGGLSLNTGNGTSATGAISIKTGNSSGGVPGSVNIDTGTGILSGTQILDDTFEGSGSGSTNDFASGACPYGCSLSASNTYAHTGSYSLKITESNQYWGIYENYLDTSVTAGDEYYFTLWFRGNAAETIAGQVDWSTGAVSNLNTITDTTTGWTEMTGDLIAPVGATAEYIALSSGSGSSSNVQYMDDFVVQNLSSITSPNVDIGATNAEAITVGNTNEAGLTSIVGGASGISEYAGSNGILNIGTQNANNVNIGNSSGTVVVQGTGTTAFQVQNSSNAAVLDVDTTDNSVGLGTTTPASSRLDIVGATSDSTTNALNATNSLGGDLLQVNDSGSINLDGGSGGNTMGYTSIGGSNGTGQDGYLIANEFTAPTTGSLSSLSAYVGSGGGVDSSPYNQFQLAIYANSSGTPGAYVASTAVGTLNSSAAWDTLPITASLTAGTSYWIVYWSNAPGTGSNSYNCVPYGGTSNGYYATSTFGSGADNGMPATFPGGAVNNVEHSLYATYAAQGVSIASSGNLTGYDAATFQDTTNSSTAFQIQNAAGSSVLVVGTSDAVNFLTYPGFEEQSAGTPLGWSAVASPTLFTQNTNTADVYNGIASLEITTTTAGTQGATTSSFTSSLPSGAQNYNISFYAMSSSAIPGNDFKVSLGGTTPTCTGSASTTLNANAMQLISCTIAATATPTSLTIIDTDTIVSTIYLDAVQLQSGTSSTPYQFATTQLRGLINNPVNIQPTANSTSAFTVANSAGTQVLTVSTSSSASSQVIIGVGTAGEANPTLFIVDSGTSTDPTGVNGAIYYNTDGAGGPAGTGTGEGEFRCYQGGAWRDCIGMPDMTQQRWGFRSAAGGGTSGTTLTSVNVQAPSVSGTATAGTSTVSDFINYSGTAIEGVTGDTSFNTDTRTEYLPKYEARIYVDPTAISTVNYWVALSSNSIASNTPPTSSTSATGSYGGIGYLSTVNSGKWVCASGDGTNQTGVNTGVTVTIGHYYDMIIDLSVSGTLTCSISDNGGAFVSVSKNTNMPAATSVLGMQAAADASSGTRNIGIAYQWLGYQ